MSNGKDQAPSVEERVTTESPYTLDAAKNCLRARHHFLQYRLDVILFTDSTGEYNVTQEACQEINALITEICDEAMHNCPLAQIGLAAAEIHAAAAALNCIVDEIPGEDECMDVAQASFRQAGLALHQVILVRAEEIALPLRNWRLQIGELNCSCDPDDPHPGDLAQPVECFICGCTDDNACVDPETKLPCYWVSKSPVPCCSACFDNPENAARIHDAGIEPSDLHGAMQSLRSRQVELRAGKEAERAGEAE